MNSKKSTIPWTLPKELKDFPCSDQGGTFFYHQEAHFWPETAVQTQTKKQTPIQIQPKPQIQEQVPNFENKIGLNQISTSQMRSLLISMLLPYKW